MTIANTKEWSLSLYQAGSEEASIHKWIESEKRGHDVGYSAVREWYSDYWYGHCRRGRIEHLIGNRCWEEFEEEQFGALEEMLQRGDLLMELILDRLLYGWENLDVINWAYDWNLPINRVLELLDLFDINGARLEPHVA